MSVGCDEDGAPSFTSVFRYNCATEDRTTKRCSEQPTIGMLTAQEAGFSVQAISRRPGIAAQTLFRCKST
jgi:hypothetical protein